MVWKDRHGLIDVLTIAEIVFCFFWVAVARNSSRNFATGGSKFADFHGIIPSLRLG
jgi:hypothetical protein